MQATSALYKYQSLLDLIFAPGECIIDMSPNNENNLIVTLASGPSSGWSAFANQFQARLERLNKQYPHAGRERESILRLAKDIASRNYNGSYAELVAIDFMNRGVGTFWSNPADLNVDIPASRTFVGSSPQRQVANLDGHLTESDVFFDVKTLQDVTDGILTPIMQDLADKYNAIILSERSSAYDYSVLGAALKTIKLELDAALNDQKSYVKITCVPDLAFRIAYRPGIVSTATVLNPYRDALARHAGVFDYGSKFVLDAPFLLILVMPPWTNRFDSQGTTEYSKEFYRAMARRVFCQYLLRPDTHTRFGATYGEMSKAISGMLFLKVHDGLTDDPAKIVTPFAFVNPNANYKLPTFVYELLREESALLIHGFEYDNY